MNVEKRTRTAITDSWGVWTITTDAPPYTNTTLVEYRPVEQINIDITDLTNGSIQPDDNNKFEWVGTGVFDLIIGAVNGNIKAQYDSGRIKDADYAQVYLGALQSSISAAIQFLLQEKTAEAQAALTIKQQGLVDRQTKGFDDDAKQKLLKQALDSWSIAYSVAQDANAVPDSIKVNTIDSLMKNAFTAVGVTVTNDPIGEA